MAECIKISISKESLECSEESIVTFELIDSEQPFIDLYISYGTTGRIGWDYIVIAEKGSTTKKIKLINGEVSTLILRNINDTLNPYNIQIEAINSNNIVNCEFIPSIAMLSCVEYIRKKRKLCFNPFPIDAEDAQYI